MPTYLVRARLTWVAVCGLVWSLSSGRRWICGVGFFIEELHHFCGLLHSAAGPMVELGTAESVQPVSASYLLSTATLPSRTSST
jgi:hypothetical protein